MLNIPPGVHRHVHRQFPSHFHRPDTERHQNQSVYLSTETELNRVTTNTTTCTTTTTATTIITTTTAAAATGFSEVFLQFPAF